MAIDTVVLHDHDANIAIPVEAIHICMHTISIAFLVLIKWETHDDRRCT
jgi:hypothetical protein